ncbi:regulatory LuxR family protein [Lentzea atacamensis]|uniref:Regulatory LuxR family protein n=1 Tax=Lentzea atacamensis TaxID=531938 RepID=A0A316HWT2_9PSEU|nr:LuxR C-terminal-related transcriptional regulator [Lentzea atacamensis]PWK79452.1 regulatory LuxR family protein [Lentzea atacamensis]
MVAPLRPGLVDTVVRQAGGVLVGREREITALTDALSGGARSCVVHGSTGMGKSALLSVASSIAVRSGMRPVRGLRALSGADRHTLLVVDDVERLSAEETERLARFRGAVVLAGDFDPECLDLVADAVRVPLRPVDAGVVAEMIRRRFDVEASPELTALCLDHCGGAPGVLSDVLDLVDPGEVSARSLRGLRLPRLLRAVRRYWQVLDGEAVAVAQALAVLGSAPLDLLCEVAGMESCDALAAFERLTDARLVLNEPMRIHSPALSHAIWHEMAPESRERLHRAAAEVMHRRSDPATAVAEHLVACPQPVGEQWVAPVLRTAARLHRAAGRPESAVRCLRAALREPMSGQVVAQVAIGMADLHLRCGIPPRADELSRCWQRLTAAGNPDGALDRLAAVVLDWQCDEDVLGVPAGDEGPPVSFRALAMAMSPLSEREVIGDSPVAAALRAFWSGQGAERVLGDLPEFAMPPLVLAGLGLLHGGSEHVLLDLAPGDRLVGAENDWLVALQMWAHRANGDHAEVFRLMHELAEHVSPARGCAALAAAAFVASCVDTGRFCEAREMLVRLGYTGTLSPAWVCTLLLRHRARMHLALGAPRAALADAERAGAAEIASVARAALTERPAPVRGGAWGKLTPHEARIVELALDGETNREIALRFNVTQRTVELHLTRVYRKAGISRRVQLSSVFGPA